VWRLTRPLYGEADAGRLWNKTLHKQLVKVQNFLQSDHDPCYYYKIYPDGTRLDIVVYVDDGWSEDDAGPNADRDLAILAKKFAGELGPMEYKEPSFFLGQNCKVNQNVSTTFTNQAYILKMADTYLPGWRERPIQTVPSTKKLREHYEAAREREYDGSRELMKGFGGLVGSLIYTLPCVRVDAAQSIGLLARALTFPTDDLLEDARDVLTYLAQTAELGVTYSNAGPDAAVLTAHSDSDWSTGHSTTGWVIRLAGGSIAYASKRQPCIAMSTTEAEIIAASTCACEIMYFRSLLEEMGLPQERPTTLFVDNKGAVELSRDRKSCHRSRHVDRRFFKVRELVFAGAIKVEYIPTAENPADLLTKALDQSTFYRHARTMLSTILNVTVRASKGAALPRGVMTGMRQWGLWRFPHRSQ
jgi:hypothetical protein